VPRLATRPRSMAMGAGGSRGTQAGVPIAAGVRHAAAAQLGVVGPKEVVAAVAVRPSLVEVRTAARSLPAVTAQEAASEALASPAGVTTRKWAGIVMGLQTERASTLELTRIRHLWMLLLPRARLWQPARRH